LRVIAKKILRDFWEKHPDSEQQLKAWYQEADNATWKNPNALKKEWKNPNALKKDYPNASIIGDNRVVFNIKGNDYRLIVKINYDYQMIWVRFVGTHAQYDKINANKI